MKKIVSSLLIFVSLMFLNVNCVNADVGVGGWSVGKYGVMYSDGARYVTGWQYLNNKWYYFNENGGMLVNTWIGPYYVDSDGVWVENAANSNVVSFADKNLETVIRNKINKPTGTLYKSDVEGITALEIRNAGVTSLDGIENLSNLQGLGVLDDSVYDIDSVKYLTKLNGIALRSMQLKNMDEIISVLKNKSNLRTISLYGNYFTYADKQKLANALPNAFTNYLTINKW